MMCAMALVVSQRGGTYLGIGNTRTMPSLMCMLKSTPHQHVAQRGHPSDLYITLVVAQTGVTQAGYR